MLPQCYTYAYNVAYTSHTPTYNVLHGIQLYPYQTVQSTCTKRYTYMWFMKKDEVGVLLLTTKLEFYPENNYKIQK